MKIAPMGRGPELLQANLRAAAGWAGIRITPFPVTQNRDPEPPLKGLDLNQQDPQLSALGI
jgi:hypothetical protein